MSGWLQLVPHVSLRTFLIFGGNSVKPSCHPKTSPSNLLLNDGTRRLKVGSTELLAHDGLGTFGEN